jgi:hypothetical protein
LDDGIPAPVVEGGDPGERDFAAVGETDAHALEVAGGLAFGLRITHHHFHLVAPALETLGFLAVEPLAELARDILEAQPEGFAFGGEAGEPDLAFAFEIAIGNIGHAVEGSEFCLHMGNGLIEQAEILAGDLDIDGQPAPGGEGLEFQIDGAGNATGEFPPFGRELIGLDLAAGGRAEFEGDLADVVGLGGAGLERGLEWLGAGGG